MHRGVIAERLPDGFQIGRCECLTRLYLARLCGAEGEPDGLSALGERHKNEAITERNRQFDTDRLAPDISRNALHEKRKARPVPAHRPNNPEQQCYAPLLHSRGQRNTLKGLIYLDSFGIQKSMVPRKGLDRHRPKGPKLLDF